VNVVVAPENRGRQRSTPRKSPWVIYRPHQQSVYTLAFRHQRDGEDTSVVCGLSEFSARAI